MYDVRERKQKGKRPGRRDCHESWRRESVKKRWDAPEGPVHMKGLRN